MAQERNVSVDLTFAFETKVQALAQHKGQFEFSDDSVRF